MNWDRKLIAENEALGGTIDLRMDHSIAGAQWMRRQLRTDEAIERVAIHMCATTMQEQIWPRLNTDEQDEWRAEARAAIAALIGEEP